MESDMNFDMLNRITDIFNEFGIPADLKGFHHARYAVLEAYVDYKAAQNSVTKFLYPTVAEHFGTTPPRVERAIRHAINTAWKNGKNTALSEYFGDGRDGKAPTNSQFVLTLADRLLRENGICPAV